MRPHKLVMKAFGPFAGETVVDFDAMGDNVYLITGDTGAGKTTIFDAIIYGLYGTASGSGRSDLSTEAFHSDYAKDGAHRDEMKVELTFSNAGRTFTVTRTINWGKSGSSKTAQKISTLYENGSLLVSGKGKESSDDVSKKIREILGLDADQFRRIIMLAQGEFRRFLEADSKERGDILGKLYNNTRHQDIQLRLKAASALLQERDRALVQRAKLQLENWRFPEDALPEERESIGADHPALYSAMDSMICRLETSHSTVKAEIERKTKAKGKIEEARTRGEQQNHLLDELAGKRSGLALLEAQKDSVEERKVQTELAEAAGKVFPELKTRDQAQRDLVRAEAEREALEVRRDQLAERAEVLAETKQKTAEANQPVIAERQAEIASLSNILHFYKEREASRKLLALRQSEHRKASAALKKAEKDLEEAQTRKESLTKTIERLEKAGDAAVEMTETEVKNREERGEKLEALAAAVRKVQKLEKEAKVQTGKLMRAEEEQTKALNRYQDVNRRFVLGQAGLLAKELREQLESGSRTVRCPVCGAEHTLADAENFAEYHEDEIPTKAVVDQAMQDWMTAKDSQNLAESALASKRKELELKQGEVREDSELLLGRDAVESAGVLSTEDVPGTAGESAENSGRWNWIRLEKTICQAADRNQEDLDEVSRKRDQAVADRKEKAEALKARPEAEQAVVQAEAAQKNAKEADHQAETAEKLAAAELENRKKQLEGYPETEADAKEQIRQLENSAKKLQSQIDEAAARAEQCAKDRAEAEGSAAAKKEECAARKQAALEADAGLQESLKRQNFASLEAFDRARSPKGICLNQEELEQWISDKKAEIRKYENDCRDAAAAVKTLSESTKGVERTDIQALSDQIDAADEELKLLQRTERGTDGMLRQDKEIRRQLRKIREERAGYLKAAAKLKPMADAANSRRAFSRYVLSDFFHRIIDQANIHLEEMTDGEYCLIPTEEGDGRSSLGLELKVLNTITGIQRETASLSGGQSFEASLSLALGLSDMAQMESTGTIRIDSMFIDEGFGSLDGERLEKAIGVLEHLSADKRQIGIISHVSRLEECLNRKIRVIAGEKGSRVKIETDM